MADAFNIQTLGDEGAQAVQLAVDDIVTIGRRRTDGDVNVAADQSVDGFLTAVIRNGLRVDTQDGEQSRDHGVAVVAGAAGGGVGHGVASVSIIDQALDVSDAALGVGQDDELGDTDTNQRIDVIDGVVHIDEAGGQGEQGTIAAEQSVAVIFGFQEGVHADGTGTAGVVLNDHGNTQDLVAVGSDLTSDDVRAAAQAPGLNNGDFLFRPIGGGFFLLGSGGLGLRLFLLGCRGFFLRTTSSQTHDHDQCQEQRHKLLHCVFSFLLILINSGLIVPESITRLGHNCACRWQKMRTFSFFGKKNSGGYLGQFTNSGKMFPEEIRSLIA